VDKELSVPVWYKEQELNLGFRIDLLVNHSIILELKAIEEIKDIHKAQVITYLKLTDYHLGYLVNFNTIHLHDGIYTFTNHPPKYSS
jgi:GxxExxY protein